MEAFGFCTVDVDCGVPSFDSVFLDPGNCDQTTLGSDCTPACSSAFSATSAEPITCQSSGEWSAFMGTVSHGRALLIMRVSMPSPLCVLLHTSIPSPEYLMPIHPTPFFIYICLSWYHRWSHLCFLFFSFLFLASSVLGFRNSYGLLICALSGCQQSTDACQGSGVDEFDSQPGSLPLPGGYTCQFTILVIAVGAVVHFYSSSQGRTL